MAGTEWTKPGRGATVRKLMALTTVYNFGVKHKLYIKGDKHRTNLRLTGEPLTAEDLERIAKCK